MMRVNLLPHREIRRKQQQQQFALALALVAIVGAALAYGVYFYLSEQYDDHVSRNKYLTEEIAKVDKEIAEINRLKEQTASLLARKQVVETLQSNRSETVHLLDQLVRQLPDGMYLRSVKQQGAKVVINGVTQSQARVSTLMRNLESSQKLGNPALVEIKALPQGTTRANEFTMNVDIIRPKSEKG
ncbi:MAG TPA: PilN domain-containing protein [Burkholderiales bacterium]|nr:PilN domain-containing protein [Burkholderiales bacterium]